MDASTGLVWVLLTLAALGFAYRLYRYLAKDGPLDDVLGGGLLGGILIAIAILVASDVGFGRWAALIYGIAFELIVMPFWVLAVMIPSRPKPLDITFTVLYDLLLAATIVLAIAA